MYHNGQVKSDNKATNNNCILLIRIAFYQELDKSSLFIHILNFKAIADIAMCVKDKECPMKFSCYRHTAPWNPFRQTILVESPREEGKFYCPDFWDNTGRTLDEKFKEYEKIEYGKVHKSLPRKKKSTKKEASS